jgi:hypothetical protein
MRPRIGVLPFVALALAACTSSSSTPATTNGATTESLVPCTPYGSTVQELVLDEIVAVGRAADGTLFVVDRVNGNHRVFASVAGVLQRRSVLGSGETSGELTLSCSDDVGPFQIKVESSGGVPTRMGFFRGELTDAKTFDIGTQGEALELVDAGAVAGMTVRDMALTQSVLYDALTADGHRLVATSPTHDARYEDYRIFYGVPADMTERVVRDAMGGGTLFMTFDLDGVWATANFPSQFSGPPNDVAKIQFENDARPQMPMTILDASADPPVTALSYRCR